MEISTFHTPEDVFVALMDYLDDVEYYIRNPKAFREYVGGTLKQRTQAMRISFASIPHEDWVKIHSQFMFAPDMYQVLQDIIEAKGSRDNLDRALGKGATVLEQVDNWTEPPIK